MSQRASPTAIGAFVLGAVVILVAAVVALGSGRCFRQTVPVALYFEGDVNGLEIGAPVKFRGVAVGRVTQIRLRIDPQANLIDIPVQIELDAERLRGAGVEVLDRSTLDQAVSNGLRARLETQSLLTGLRFVQLDFVPDGGPGHVGGEQHGLLEIPTLPTTLEQAEDAIRAGLEKLGEIDFAGLIIAFRDAAQAVRELVGSDQAESTIASVNEAVRSVTRLTESLERDVGPVTESLRATSEQTTQTVKQLEGAARSARELLDPDSPVAVRLAQALQEISAAARSMRVLAESLERDPSALVRGRAQPREERP